MDKLKIQIFNEHGTQVKKLTASKREQLVYYHEMFQGTRYFDMTEQAEEFLASANKTSEQTYTLRCSFLKFGDMTQEVTHFKVIMTKH